MGLILRAIFTILVGRKSSTVGSCLVPSQQTMNRFISQLFLVIDGELPNRAAIALFVIEIKTAVALENRSPYPIENPVYRRPRYY